MVFSSIPPNYLDHHNWHHQLQQPSDQQGSGGGGNPQLPPPPPPPPSVGGGEGSIRPGSMVDRARLAKLPLPEPGLNCPRCDSTNTKFCYFNNYSLTQPRHFCKTCRRYWTRGGALRNVPVGGGCRRNKRSKSRSSKSPSTNEQSGSQTGPKSISASPSSCSTEMNSHFSQPSLQFPFMGALQNLSQFASGGTISSNLGGFQPQNDMGFQIGVNSNGNNNILSADNWRLPFLAGFEVPNNLFQFQSEGVEAAAAAASSMAGGEIRSSSGNNTEAAPVKVEETRGLNLSRQLLDISENNSTTNQHWVGTSWTDQLSGLNTSSTTHFI